MRKEQEDETSRKPQHTLAPNVALDQIDNFAIYYWGSAATICVLSLMYIFMRYGIFENDANTKASSDRYSLYENIWALVLVASVGKAHIVSKDSGKKNPIPVGAVFPIVAVLFILQIVAVLLIVGSIDPQADPLTKRPASPWLQHRDGTTVNTMKVIMTIFLGASQIGEISQCRRLALVSWNVHPDALSVPRWIPMLGAVMQYSVALCVVWSGVVVILSFATCLDIVYSSMSVVFITSGDEMFFDMFEEVCDVETDFDVLQSHHHHGSAVHQRRTGAAMPIHARETGASPSDSDDETAEALSTARTDRSSQDNRRRRTPVQSSENVALDEPMWLWALLKVLTIFPLVWAFGILGRAMYTGIMPLARLQHTLSGLKVM